MGDSGFSMITVSVACELRYYTEHVYNVRVEYISVLMHYVTDNVFFSNVGTISCLPGLNWY